MLIDRELPPMKLAFVVNSLRRAGAERHTIELAGALARRGHRCSVVMLQNANELGEPEGVNVTTCNGNGLSDRKAQQRLGGLLNDLAPHIVVPVNERSTFYAHRAKPNAPIAPVYHTTAIPGLKRNLVSRFERRYLRRSDHLIFISETQATHWRRRGLSRPPSTVIHNGVDRGRFNPEVRVLHRETMRTRLGFSRHDFVIGITAAFRPEKNHRQAVEAVVGLCNRGIPAHLLCVGSGPQEHEIRQFADSRNARVTFAGAQPDVVPYLAAFDVGILTSSAVETLSLAALETMAMGVPVVLSDVGGAREIVMRGVEGFVYPPHDTEQLIDRLLVFADSAVAVEMGANAARTARTRFSYDEMVNQYEDIFSRLVEKSRSPSC
jgi:L-malate glycosyltransferase